MKKLSDIELVELFYDGKESAFDWIYKRHFQKSKNYYTNKFFNLIDIEDVYSDAWIKIYDSLLKRKYQPTKTKLTTYLNRIIFNACIDGLRKQKTSGQSITKNFDEETWKVICNSHIDDIKDDDYYEKMSKLKSISINLKPHYQELIKDRLEGKKYREIALELGMPLNTVKGQVKRALDIVRDKIQDSPKPDVPKLPVIIPISDKLKFFKPVIPADNLKCYTCGKTKMDSCFYNRRPKECMKCTQDRAKAKKVLSLVEEYKERFPELFLAS